MKQNICVVIFLLLSTICKAQTFIYPQNDSILTEYNDGKFWAYLNKNDFVVGLSCFEEKDDYGKYYHLDIFIKNLSETPIIFQPPKHSIKATTQYNIPIYIVYVIVFCICLHQSIKLSFTIFTRFIRDPVI